MRLAYLLTGDRTLAEDLVQEAFVRLARRFTHLRDPQGFDAYLRRTVVNLAHSHFRRLKVERAFLKRQAGARRFEAEDPDIVTQHWFREALLSLPPRQRIAIVLRFYEDLSERQAAEVMRCRPGTVKALVHQAKEVLRRQVSDE
jgi:RNA polymerase sigma factor (sigma-70 family)